LGFAIRIGMNGERGADHDFSVVSVFCLFNLLQVVAGCVQQLSFLQGIVLCRAFARCASGDFSFLYRR